MPTQEMKALCNPTRTRLLNLVRGDGRQSQSRLVERSGAHLAIVAYHCRTLCESNCIGYAPGSGPDSHDPVFEAL